MGAEGGFADAGGVRIHYLDFWPAQPGPALLLVHATGFHAHVWDPIVPALAERFRVVALDQRGHGDSDKPASGYDWTSFGMDVLAVVDHLGLRRPAGMGHSAGAAALVFAETHRPGTFSRLVLMDPVTPHPRIRRLMTGAENPLALGARRRRRVWDSPHQMTERLRAGTPLATWREEFLRAYAEHGLHRRPEGHYELKCPPDIEAQVYENGGRHSGWELLAKLDCPVLLLVGELSELWGAELRDEMAQRLRYGRVEVVGGRGHFFPMEDPDATLARAQPFLQG